ncbi:putative thioredoxin [Usnea florida]
MIVVNIGVVSDFVCAWCYIGKRTLERAISLYQKTYPEGKKDIFSVMYRPCYLNYNPSPHSVDKRELAETKLSGMSSEKVAAMTQRVNQIGRSVGITFSSGGKIGSTRDAHRLVHLSQSKSPNVQDALVNKLFEAYHELEKDISSQDILREVARGAGLDGSEVDEWLNSSVGGDVVDAQAESNRKLVTSGVPTFIIQGKHRVDGAQDPEEFLQTFVNVKEGKL